MQQSPIAQRVSAIRAALDRAYPRTQPRQIRQVNNNSPATCLGNLLAAVEHAKWTACAAQQDVTDSNMPSATLVLEWLEEFISVNDVRITVEA
ncbi:MAG: hypothetical protein ACYCZ0_02000 [Minisyncoccota bacterium]